LAMVLLEVEVDQGILDLLVSEKLLDGEQVDALLQEVGRKTMAEGVDADRLGYMSFFLTGKTFFEWR
jgi:hypothetical protein